MSLIKTLWKMQPMCLADKLENHQSNIESQVCHKNRTIFELNNLNTLFG
jgi:hypothetical protein